MWSATTTKRRAREMKVRFVCASAMFGVVNPATGSIPWTPKNRTSTCRDLMDTSAGGPNQSARRRPRLTTGEYHGRIPTTLQFVPDVQGVGDHGEALAPGQAAGQRPCRRARRQGHGHPGLDHLRRPVGYGRLLRLLALDLVLESGLLRAQLRQHRASVDALDQAFFLEGVEVPPHSHLRDSQCLAQFGETGSAFGLELFQICLRLRRANMAASLPLSQPTGTNILAHPMLLLASLDGKSSATVVDTALECAALVDIALS